MRLRAAAGFLLLFAAGGIASLTAAPVGDEPALGPLGGRNVYAPHLPWYSFPADRAAPGAVGALKVRSALYYLNEFSTYPFDPEDYTLDGDGRIADPTEQDSLTAMDYESTVWEIGIDWQALEQWRFSADWRLHARYGGGLDGLIEWWHHALGVPNAGREYFDVNRSVWNVTGSTIDDFSGSGTVVASGDLDLRAHWSFFSRPKFYLAASGAFKIPTGYKAAGFGSGYPDLALGLYLDWIPWRWLAMYVGGGVIFPLGPNGRIMGQFIPAVEFRLSRGFSLVIQANIQSSPVQGYEAYMHPVTGESVMFALPQTDLKIGMKGQIKNLGWELYFEEDTITWEGPDFVLFLGFSYTFLTIDPGDRRSQ